MKFQILFSRKNKKKYQLCVKLSAELALRVVKVKNRDDFYHVCISMS